ncbi:MAG: hypothetical protein QOE85_307, partial [Actinomycetota bacterium]|nr:hypothetical protein [Actinomycetota bacterium]
HLARIIKECREFWRNFEDSWTPLVEKFVNSHLNEVN